MIRTKVSNNNNINNNKVSKTRIKQHLLHNLFDNHFFIPFSI
jgi:hypothetical protein